MRAVAAGVNHPLRNALVVEVKHLLAEMKILKQRGTARPDLERILIVRHGPALGGGQHGHIARRNLVQFAALAAGELLIVDRCRPGRCPFTPCHGLG